MTHTVVVNQFEGPLGLLLELVEQGKFEVTSISIAQITTSYVSRLNSLTSLSTEEMGEFAGLGARLLYIKSLALLPQTAATAQVEELAQLNLELQDYLAIKHAAAKLAARARYRSWPHPARQLAQAAAPRPLPHIQMSALQAAFTAALARNQPVLPTGTVSGAPHVSLERAGEQLRRQLAGGNVSLEKIIESCGSRLEIVVMFMATLELIHAGATRVVQNGQFAPITLEANRA